MNIYMCICFCVYIINLFECFCLLIWMFLYVFIQNTTFLSKTWANLIRNPSPIFDVLVLFCREMNADSNETIFIDFGFIDSDLWPKMTKKCDLICNTNFRPNLHRIRTEQGSVLALVPVLVLVLIPVLVLSLFYVG